MNGLSEVSVGDEDPAPRMKRTQRYTHEASCCGRIYHRWVSRKGESLAGDQVCPACRKRLTWERQFGWHSPTYERVMQRISGLLGDFMVEDVEVVAPEMRRNHLSVLLNQLCVRTEFLERVRAGQRKKCGAVYRRSAKFPQLLSEALKTGEHSSPRVLPEDDLGKMTEREKAWRELRATMEVPE